MSTLDSVATTTAGALSNAWKRDNRFAQFQVAELHENRFTIRATGVTATQDAEPVGLPEGVSLLRQTARVADNPGATGFNWQAEFTWSRPFTQWLSELIAGAVVRLFTLFIWMAITLVVIGVCCLAGYLVVGIVRARLSASAPIAESPPRPSPPTTATPAPIYRKPAEVVPADIPIEECQGDTCHIGKLRH